MWRSDQKWPITDGRKATSIDDDADRSLHWTWNQLDDGWRDVHTACSSRGMAAQIRGRILTHVLQVGNKSGRLPSSNWRRSGVMWSDLDSEEISQAAAFITDWSRWKRCWGIPASVASLSSRRVRTSDVTSDWNTIGTTLPQHSETCWHCLLDVGTHRHVWV